MNTGRSMIDLLKMFKLHNNVNVKKKFFLTDLKIVTPDSTTTDTDY